MRRVPPLSYAALLVAALLAAGCAKGPPEDPWQAWNRPVFRFNDAADTWVLRPVALGWKFVTFEELRHSVRRFFFNLAFPSRFVTEEGATVLRTLPGGIEILSSPVAENATAAGKNVGEVSWPAASGLIALQHGNQASVPAAEDKINAGDTLVAIVAPEAKKPLLDLLG